jgi:hypothetical protein
MMTGKLEEAFKNFQRLPEWPLERFQQSGAQTVSDSRSKPTEPVISRNHFCDRLRREQG